MAVSKTAKTLLIIGGILFAIVLVAVIGIALAVESFSKPDVPDNSVLVLKLAGDVPDYSPPDPMAKAFGVKQPNSLTDIITQLRKAKADTRIGGVLLDINFPGTGWGKAEELRRAIKDFRASGKPVYAFMELGLNQNYYIASAADKVFMPPAGDLYVNGLAAEAMFYKGSLDKLGIEPEVIKIGKYKNAPDQFTRKDMSDEQREVLNALLDQFYGSLVNAIAEDRKKSPEDVKTIIDNAPYHGTEALKLGLIDGAFYRDQVVNDLKNRLGYKADDDLRTVSDNAYRDVPADSLGINVGEKVAVIYASGTITSGSSGNSPVGGQSVGSDTIIQAVKDAAKDDSIKAIVLRVDSPGGSALASDMMWHAIEDAKAKKPVVVSMGDVAASGGYYISCNANKIIAEPSTITGSIGVFLGKPVIKGFYDWIGVTNEYVMRGENAGIFRETEKWTDKERAKMEEQANKIYYDDFVPKVAKGRNMTPEQVNNLGQGRVWTGAQAKQNGLIDDFGGLEKAIDTAKVLAKLPADKEVQRIAYPKPQSLFQRLFGGGDSTFTQTREQQAQAAVIKSLPEDIRRGLRYAEMFNQMKNGESMLIIPYEIRIK